MKPLYAFILGAVLAIGAAMVVSRDSGEAQPPTPVRVSAVEAPVPAPLPVEPEVETRPSPAPLPAPAEVERPRPAVRPRPEPTRPVARVEEPRAPAVTPPASVPAPAPPVRQVPDITPNVPPMEVALPRPTPRVEPRDEPPPPPKVNSVTVPTGTTLNVRLAQTLTSAEVSEGDAFSATLDQPLVVDGWVIAERGARVEGKVVSADPGGRVRGLASLGLELTRFTTADGQRVEIRTTPFTRTAENSKRDDAAKVGAAAGIGAAIGAIAGGGKGAAIGAAAGGAAGAGGVIATRGKAATLPVETRLSFRLSEAVTITEKR